MRHGLYLLLALASLAGCSENSVKSLEPAAEEGQPPGSILGRVCDPSGRHWLPDAMAYANLIDTNGKLYDTRKSYTDRDGYFLLDDMPSGTVYTVYIQYGDEILQTHEVNVENGDEMVLEEPDCFDPLELDVAVISGDYDDFQTVLSHMGFANYEVIDGLIGAEMAGFLTDLDKMLQYDIIVFNGGHVEEGLIYPAPVEEEDDADADGGPVFDMDEDADADADADDTGDPAPEETGDPEPDGEDTGDADADDGDSDGGAPSEPLDVHETIIENLRNYVAAGGAVYASDWAYDVVEQAWPEAIDFVGADAIPNSAQKGEYGEVDAIISDEYLALWLEAPEDRIAIEYDLPVWPPIVGPEEGSTINVHLRGSIDYRGGIHVYNMANSPLLVSFASGEGKVAYSTFRIAKNADRYVVLTLQYMMYSL